MKLVFILGNTAVGKMTVGQELMKITDLRLFHNHMTIEPVLEIFGGINHHVVSRLREVIFEEFAQSDNEGMIFTYMMAFDLQSEWDYLAHVRDIFLQKNPETAFYYVELVAPQQVRLLRNTSQNRLQHKASKRDIEASNRRLLNDDQRYRVESLEGEVPFENYIKIDNTNLSPATAAGMIKEQFHF